MKIIINSSNNKNTNIISLENLDNIDETFKKFSLIEGVGPLEAKIFAINESISSHKLSKIKNNFDKKYNCLLRIYSNSRHTVLAGKSLKIDSTFIKEQ